MLQRLNEIIKRHLTDNIFSYALVTFFLILGISLGALTVSNINLDTKVDVKAYLEGFVNISKTESINSAEILKQSVKFNLVTAAFLFLAGVTYAGILLVPVIAMFRGFCLGFTVAFLTDSLKRGGFLMSLVSITPQNILYIPILIVFCVCSITLSYTILKCRINRKRNEVSSYFWSFAITAAFLFLFMVGGSIIESYITPFLVKLVASYIL